MKPLSLKIKDKDTKATAKKSTTKKTTTKKVPFVVDPKRKAELETLKKKLTEEYGVVGQIVGLAKKGFTRKEIIELGKFNKNTVHRQVREYGADKVKIKSASKAKAKKATKVKTIKAAKAEPVSSRIVETVS